ncbi:MAG: LuxR C-terminal-related transcriptional regulator [Anaerolineae bacterium]
MDDHTASAASLPPAPLVATKLAIPPVRPALVARPRLMQRLDACLAHPLTLISAPAGFGKTTLVSAWARAAAMPVTWLALDEADNNPARFLSYLAAAIRGVVPAVGRDLPGPLGASPVPPDVVIATLINGVAAHATPFVLVLDDYHVLDDEDVHEALRRLVAYQPPQLHLVIVTREDPQLPLARLRARGQLIDLRAQDLRFTPDEVATFVRDVMGVALERPQIAELDARIEGWIAGWQLAALSMQGRRDPADLLDGLSGGHHFILTYLTEEVLAQLPPDMQSFLMETSILDRLSGPLCDAVTERNDADAVMERLYATNAFVVALDDAHHWYRYHHLFADLLRTQLSRKAPQRLPILHGRASAWYEGQGDAANAIEHAFAAADYARVVRRLEAHAREVVLEGYAQSVEDWLRRLPHEWQAAGPRANLAFGWSLLLRGQTGEIEAYLRHAEAAAAERGPDDETAKAIVAEAKALRAGLVSLQGDAERACDMARNAVAQAPPDDLYLQGMTRFCLGTAYNYAGQVAAAIDTYLEALPLCRAANNTLATMLIVANLIVLYMIRGQLEAADDLTRRVMAGAARMGTPTSPALATVYMGHSEVLYERNETEAARDLLERWLDISRRGGHVAAVAYGHVLLSRIEQARGDLDAAAAALDHAAQLRQHRMPGWVAPQIVAQEVALALGRGDTATAAQALSASGVQITDAASYAREVIHIAYLRLLLHLGRRAPSADDLGQALDLAGRVLQSAEPAGRMGRVIETLALRALVWQARGEMQQARADLGRALALGEPEGYARVFINEGEPMQRLLADLRAARPQYVARLLAAFGGAPPAVEAALKPAPVTPALIEPLTERELEVLRLLADGLTYEETAQRLVVTLNTVRFHVKAIYGKLGVDRRAAAIDRARSLSLL